MEWKKIKYNNDDELLIEEEYINEKAIKMKNAILKNIFFFLNIQLKKIKNNIY